MPKATPLYWLTPKEDEALQEHLKEALAQGLIRPLSSPYGAPVFFVAKKDGGLRLVSDYRVLNAATVKNKYPLPLIDDLFNDLAGAKFFSKINLTAGYNQIRVKEEDIPKTAFRTRYGSFECKVLNFWMTNAPLTFVTFINELFKSLVRKCVVVYLNDIIVYSRTKQEHWRDLKSVMNLFKRN